MCMPQPPTIGTAERILIGAVGGCSIVLVNLVQFDPATLFDEEFQLMILLGYTIQAVAFLLLGGIVAYLDSGERDRRRIFFLGLTAPAVFMAVLNANNAIGQTLNLDP